jgi:hypothetical protein
MDDGPIRCRTALPNEAIARLSDDTKLELIAKARAWTVGRLWVIIAAMRDLHGRFLA